MKSFLQVPLKFSLYCPYCALDAAQALDQVIVASLSHNDWQILNIFLCAQVLTLIQNES